MELSCQKIKNEILLEYLDEYFKNNQKKLDKAFMDQSIKMVNKLYDHTKEMIVKNHVITFGTKTGEGWTELKYSDIVTLQNIKMAYTYYLCLKDLCKESFVLTILKRKYYKEAFEIEEYFSTISTLFMYNVDMTSKALSINKIDKILSIGSKDIKYAKNIRNSITTRLTTRKDDTYFRTHPKTIYQIVPIEKLGKYLEIADKHTNIECPICGKNIQIDKENIKQIIEFNYPNIRIICNHESTDYQKVFPFSLKIDKYIEHTSTKNLNVQMFVLNNYDKLVNKFSIFPSLRKITKTSQLIHMHDLDDSYLNIKNKYIFIDCPTDNTNISTLRKIKVTEENLLQLFNVDKEEKKVYINLPIDKRRENYKQVAYVNLEHLISNLDINDSYTSKDIVLTLVNNYKLLCLKKLIYPTSAKNLVLQGGEDVKQ